MPDRESILKHIETKQAFCDNKAKKQDSDSSWWKTLGRVYETLGDEIRQGIDLA